MGRGKEGEREVVVGAPSLGWLRGGRGVGGSSWGGAGWGRGGREGMLLNSFLP